MGSLIKPDSWIIRLLDEFFVNPTQLPASWLPLPRVLGLQLIYRRICGYWTGGEILLPAPHGDGWMWRNGLISLRVHLPFCISLHIRLPFKYADRWWGWTIQACVGWKPYDGRFALTGRIQNDDHQDYNNPTGPVGRARGLDEGFV